MPQAEDLTGKLRKLSDAKVLPTGDAAPRLKITASKGDFRKMAVNVPGLIASAVVFTAFALQIVFLWTLVK